MKLPVHLIIIVINKKMVKKLTKKIWTILTLYLFSEKKK